LKAQSSKQKAESRKQKAESRKLKAESWGLVKSFELSALSFLLL
jgi:hypothetical protein